MEICTRSHFWVVEETCTCSPSWAVVESGKLEVEESGIQVVEESNKLEEVVIYTLASLVGVENNKLEVEVIYTLASLVEVENNKLVVVGSDKQVEEENGKLELEENDK